MKKLCTLFPKLRLARYAHHYANFTASEKIEIRKSHFFQTSTGEIPKFFLHISRFLMGRIQISRQISAPTVPGNPSKLRFSPFGLQTFQENKSFLAKTG